MRRYAVVRTDANHHLFEIANVSMHIAPVWTQIENWISDDLSRTVIRHITATTGFIYLDATRRKVLLAGSHVRTAITSDAESDYWRMLEKDQQIRDTAGPTLFDEHLLKIERLSVGNQPEAANFESP